jgi:hypothetical protein
MDTRKKIITHTQCALFGSRAVKSAIQACVSGKEIGSTPLSGGFWRELDKEPSQQNGTALFSCRVPFQPVVVDGARVVDGCSHPHRLLANTVRAWPNPRLKPWPVEGSVHLGTGGTPHNIASKGNTHSRAATHTLQQLRTDSGRCRR